MMTRRQWSIAEARVRLSEVIKEAQMSPQILENRGRPVAAVVDTETLAKLEAGKPKRKGALLIEELGRILNEDTEDVSLPQPLKSAPRDPFGEDGGEA